MQDNQELFPTLTRSLTTMDPLLVEILQAVVEERLVVQDLVGHPHLAVVLLVVEQLLVPQDQMRLGLAMVAVVDHPRRHQVLVEMASSAEEADLVDLPRLLPQEELVDLATA